MKSTQDEAAAAANPQGKKSTRQLLKPTGKPYLYRHEETEIYYGIKRHKNKSASKSLGTTDRKLAEGKLKAWIDELENPTEAKKDVPTFGEVYARFLEMKKGMEDGTKETYIWLKNTFQNYKGGKAIWETPVNEVKAATLSIFTAQFQNIWKASSYNSFTLLVKQVLDVACMDEIISKNPYDLMPNKREKVISSPNEAPTIEQCEKIVLQIRNTPFASTANESGDMCEFLHRAALGEAEANYITWGHVNFTDDEIKNIERRKTGEFFDVPLYPWLKPFIQDLYERQGRPSPETKIFKMKSIKQALYKACERLNLPLYSPRDLRKARIEWMLRKGVSAESIAKYQGHCDNGVLVRRTYANVINEDTKKNQREELQRIFGTPTAKAKGQGKKKPVEV